MKKALVLSATLCILISGIVFHFRLMEAAGYSKNNHAETTTLSLEFPSDCNAQGAYPDAYGGLYSIKVRVGPSSAEYSAGLALLTQLVSSSVSFRIEVYDAWNQHLQTTYSAYLPPNTTTGGSILNKNSKLIDSLLVPFKNKLGYVRLVIENLQPRK